MKFTTRQLVQIAIFGALWGLLEMSLGAVVNTMNIPLTGLIMSTLGVIILLIGRMFVPRRGATLFMGVVTALIKLVSVSGTVIGPLMGILIEALIVELVLSIAGSERRWIFMLAGGIATLSTLAQKFLIASLIYGLNLFVIWLDMLDLGERLFGIPAESAGVLLTLLVLLHTVPGILAGIFAQITGSRMKERLIGNDLTDEGSE